MKAIQLTKGKSALVDDEDYELLSKYRWCATRGRNTWYAWRHSYHDGNIETIAMHRLILAAPDGLEVDHIDGDGLNNTRSNLRLATRSQNLHNGKRLKNNTSGYKGVHWVKYTLHAGKWRSRIYVGGRAIHLGVFADREEAAKAYDKAALEMCGEYARTNFQADFLSKSCAIHQTA